MLAKAGIQANPSLGPAQGNDPAVTFAKLRNEILGREDNRRDLLVPSWPEVTNGPFL
jgi:hypothetical protein